MTLPEAGKPHFFSQLPVGCFHSPPTICNLFHQFIIDLPYQVINSMRARTLSFALLEPHCLAASGTLKFSNL